MQGLLLSMICRHGKPTNASLAASDGELFLRTDKTLWCLGAKPRL